MTGIMRRPFQGAGGSGSGKSPIDTIDNLVATDEIEVILGLAVGPIKGLAQGLKSFYIGDTQYQNNDGSFNFTLFDLEVYPGHTPGEVITPTLGGYEDYRQGEQPLLYNQPVVSETISPSASQVILRIRVNNLHRLGTDAQLTPLTGVNNSFSAFLPNTMKLAITYRTKDVGNWVSPFTAPVEIVAKTISDEYHEVRFAVGLPGPLQVSVNNLTPNIAGEAECVAFVAGHYEVQAGTFGLTRSTAVSVTLAPAVQVVRSTDFPNQRRDGSYGIDMICVRLSVSQLFIQNDKGTFNDNIAFTIEYKPSSADASHWTNPFNQVINIVAKTTKPTPVDYRFNVQPIADTYDVRVTRLSPEEATHNRVIAWDSLEEIVGGPAQFDGVAVAHLVGAATNQFSSIPDFWGVYDLKLCRIPSNYDPYLRTYAGAWDGTFKEDWTSNPAWCLYDLAMSEVYGLRRFWRVFNLDKWDCYKAGQWCDAQVPNGQGGFQPRYTFNGVIVEPRGAMEQLRYMAGVFNGGFLDDMNGTTRLVFDHDEPAAIVFTPENVSSEGFSYAYTDTTTRFNEITAKFNNPNLNYQVDSRTKQDQDHIARFGNNPLEVAAIGCCDAHEAARRAAYKLLAATTEKEIVSFRTNRQGLMVQPFNVMLVSDPTMGQGITGRIKSLDQYRQTVWLRDPVFLELGVIYTFRTHATNPGYPDQSTDPFVLVEVPFGAPLQGETLAFELGAPLPPGVFENAQFSLGSEGNAVGVPKPYRITKIEEVDGDPDNISIEGIEINRKKWVLADNVTDGLDLDYLNFPADLGAPSVLTVETNKISINGALLANVILTWTAPLDARVNAYECEYRVALAEAWTQFAVTSRERADLYNIPDGTYDFRVRSTASHGKKSLWIESLGVPAGLDVPPDDVSSLSLSLLGDNIYLSWTPVKAVDLSYYWLKFYPSVGADAVWENAADLLPQVQNLHATVGAQTGTYFVKAVNVAGQESAHAAFASTSTQFLNHVEILSIAEDPLWRADKKNLYVEDGLLKLNVEQGFYGYYTWTSPDFMEAFTCRVNMSVVLGGEAIGVHIADWKRLADVASLSGTAAGDYTARLFIAVSQDGTTFGDFIPFATGDYKGRRFAYALHLNALKPHVRPNVRHLSVSVKVPARAETGKNVFVPTQGLTVVFNPPFRVQPIFTVTPKAARPGDVFAITDESTFGFTINYTAADGTPVGRFIDYQALGFGGH